MPRRPAPLLRWFVIAALLFLIIGLPLIFRDQFIAASDAILAAADERPLAAALFIIAALTLDLFLPVPNGVTNTLAGAAFGFALGTLVIWLGLMGASLAGYAAAAGPRVRSPGGCSAPTTSTRRTSSPSASAPSR
jgi:uncharacterized membrane protein YdjX (TVP38/TMEM64 family)